jgi:DNA polymerase-4
VGPLALDEAFLDVTGARPLFGDGRSIGHAIRAEIRAAVGLECSVGVAPNKFLAKLASEAAKPRADNAGVRPGAGVVVVAPGEELAFLHPHPVRAMWGVGPVTQQRLDRLGVHTIGDLAELGEATLVRAFGAAQGRHLSSLSNGRDDRPVETDRRAKSIGHEETFAADVHTATELHAHVVRMADLVASRLRRNDLAARTVTLKVRFASFNTVTRSVTAGQALDTGPDIVAALATAEASIDTTPGVRLIGVSGSNLAAPVEQMRLDLAGGPGGPERTPQWSEASAALDSIRARFGSEAIAPASTLGKQRRSGGPTR